MRHPFSVGLAAVGLALAFQALTVHYSYGGDWTALFCVGDRFKQPPELPKPYQFRDSWGYDGESYRLIAHDPFATRGFDRYLDGARYRYSRILIPLAAWTLAAGNDRWIDAAYIAIILASVFCGAFWLAQLAIRTGYSLWWGLLFLLAPATLVGIDRMTVDVTLAAFCVAFVVLRPGSAGWLAVLTAGALCRETGLLLIGAGCFAFAVERRVRLFAITAATAIPAVAWLAWLAVRFPAEEGARTSFIPLLGYITRLAHPLPYTLPPLMLKITQTLDYVALAGVAVALWCVWKLRTRPELWASAVPVFFVSLPDVWSEVYAFGRTMTPFWLLIAIRGVESRLWIALVPILLMDVRIAWQLLPQFYNILKGWIS